MKTNPIPQLAPATALVQLLTEHPDLPVAGWSIDSIVPTLHGHLHAGGMEALAQYAEVLGGSVRASHVYDFDGQRLRSHRLSSVWRDVPIEVAVTPPVSVVAVSS